MSAVTSYLPSLPTRDDLPSFAGIKEGIKEWGKAKYATLPSMPSVPTLPQLPEMPKGMKKYLPDMPEIPWPQHVMDTGYYLNKYHSDHVSRLIKHLNKWIILISLVTIIGGFFDENIRNMLVFKPSSIWHVKKEMLEPPPE